MKTCLFVLAVKVLERAVAAHETTQAETYPDRLTSQHALARAYHDGGRDKFGESSGSTGVGTLLDSLHVLLASDAVGEYDV